MVNGSNTEVGARKPNIAQPTIKPRLGAITMPQDNACKYSFGQAHWPNSSQHLHPILCAASSVFTYSSPHSLPHCKHCKVCSQVHQRIRTKFPYKYRLCCLLKHHNTLSTLEEATTRRTHNKHFEDTACLDNTGPCAKAPNGEAAIRTSTHFYWKMTQIYDTKSCPWHSLLNKSPKLHFKIVRANVALRLG